jgi:AraC-like DNA-binding protein
VYLEELRTLLARHARPDWTMAIDGVLISKVDRPDPPAPSMSGTVLAVIAQGAKRLALGDRVYAYGAGQFTQADPERPALGFGLTPAEVRRRRYAVGDRRQRRCARAARRGGPAAAPARRPQVGLADSGLSHVSRAVRWIREHYAQPFRVEDVARLSGMSVSAFYRNFQAVIAMSPIQFQKQIRLQEARLLLATHPGDVTGVGHRVGYDNPSQFSREYRRQFGAPPSQEAARLRNTAGIPAGVLP